MNIFKSADGIFDICFQSKDIAFDLQGKLEPFTLIRHSENENVM